MTRRPTTILMFEAHESLFHASHEYFQQRLWGYSCDVPKNPREADIPKAFPGRLVDVTEAPVSHHFDRWKAYRNVDCHELSDYKHNYYLFIESRGDMKTMLNTPLRGGRAEPKVCSRPFGCDGTGLRPETEAATRRRSSATRAPPSCGHALPMSWKSLKKAREWRARLFRLASRACCGDARTLQSC